jgi:hypothetical protein
LQMEYNKEVTSLWSAALGLVYVCFGSFVFIYFQNGNSCIFFLNTATIAFNFICKNKCYLKKNSFQRASIYRCWWLYLSSRYMFSCVICFRFIHFIFISTAHALFLTCLPVSIYGT